MPREIFGGLPEVFTNLPSKGHADKDLVIGSRFPINDNENGVIIAKHKNMFDVRRVDVCLSASPINCKELCGGKYFNNNHLEPCVLKPEV